MTADFTPKPGTNIFRDVTTDPITLDELCREQDDMIRQGNAELESLRAKLANYREAVDAEWATWFQFVFLGGGAPTATDRLSVRAAIAEAWSALEKRAVLPPLAATATAPTCTCADKRPHLNGCPVNKGAYERFREIHQ